VTKDDDDFIYDYCHGGDEGEDKKNTKQYKIIMILASELGRSFKSLFALGCS
jgi:hypothetical protein